MKEKNYLRKLFETVVYFFSRLLYLFTIFLPFFVFAAYTPPATIPGINKPPAATAIPFLYGENSQRY